MANPEWTAETLPVISVVALKGRAWIKRPGVGGTWFWLRTGVHEDQSDAVVNEAIAAGARILLP